MEGKVRCHIGLWKSAESAVDLGLEKFRDSGRAKGGVGPKSRAVGVRVPALRKLREERAAQSIGDTNEVKI